MITADSEPRRPSVRSGLALHALLLALAAPAFAQPADHVFPDGTEVQLLSDEPARTAIVDDTAEPFYSKLTLLEIAIRRGTPLGTADLEREQAAYRDFVPSCVLPWTADERTRLIDALKSAHERMTKAAPSLIPKKWRFIKTDGREELGPHTRGDCIVLHAQYLAAPAPMFEHLVIHETMHVFSRGHPRERERLYAAIGFRRLDCLELSPELERRRITNPDCTQLGYAIRVRNADGEPIDAVILTFSRHAELQSDLRVPFAYVQFALFEVRKPENCWRVVTTDAADLGGLPPNRADRFFDQVGWNTQYLIHPEEIVAENLALLVRVRSGDKSVPVPSPAILDKLEQALTAPASK
jgi:hypothetical protein